MKNITMNELYELYQDTLNKCGIHLLKESDDIIEYNIFEEFDIGIHSFLHEDNLLKLVENGFISMNKMNKSIDLREKVIELQNSKDWNIQNFRISTKWHEILELSDEIKSMK